MPTYTVICAHKSGGIEHSLMVWAPTIEEAQDRVDAAGFMVSKSFLAIPDPAPQQPLPPPQLVMDAASNLSKLHHARLIWAPIGTIATAVMIGVLAAMLLSSCLGYSIMEAIRSSSSHNTYGR